VTFLKAFCDHFSFKNFKGILKNLCGISRGGLAPQILVGNFSRSPKKKPTKEKFKGHREAPNFLEVFPYMASSPLSLSNVELLPKNLSEVMLLYQKQMCF
jgi:hypothetical protein